MSSIPSDFELALQRIANGIAEYVEANLHQLDDAIDLNPGAWDRGSPRATLHRGLVLAGAREAAYDERLEVNEELNTFRLIGYEGDREFHFRVRCGERDQHSQLRMMTNSRHGLLLQQDLPESSSLFQPVAYGLGYFKDVDGLIREVVVAEQSDVIAGNPGYVTFGPETMLYPGDSFGGPKRSFRPGPVDDDLFGDGRRGEEPGSGDAA